MTSLHDAFGAVQQIQIVGLPERLAPAGQDGRRPEPAAYRPDPDEEAEYRAFCLALDGEEPVIPGWATALVRGRDAGRAARWLREARELGFEQGWEGTGLVAPHGMSDAERAEYDRGYGEGLEEARQWSAFVADRETDLPEHVRDQDLYPAGCAS